MGASPPSLPGRRTLHRIRAVAAFSLPRATSTDHFRMTMRPSLPGERGTRLSLICRKTMDDEQNEGLQGGSGEQSAKGREESFWVERLKFSIALSLHSPNEQDSQFQREISNYANHNFGGRFPSPSSSSSSSSIGRALIGRRRRLSLSAHASMSSPFLPISPF